MKKFFNLDFLLVILNFLCVIAYTIVGAYSGNWIYCLCGGLWGITTVFNTTTWWIKWWK